MCRSRLDAGCNDAGNGSTTAHQKTEAESRPRRLAQIVISTVDDIADSMVLPSFWNRQAHKKNPIRKSVDRSLRADKSRYCYAGSISRVLITVKRSSASTTNCTSNTPFVTVTVVVSGWNSPDFVSIDPANVPFTYNRSEVDHGDKYWQPDAQAQPHGPRVHIGWSDDSVSRISLDDR